MKDCLRESRVSASSCTPAVETIACGRDGETEMDEGRTLVENRDVDTWVMTSLLSPDKPLLYV